MFFSLLLQPLCPTTSRCCDVDYVCEDIESTVLPLSMDYDQHLTFQDLRCIHGLSDEALLHIKDIQFGDVIRSTRDDQQRLQAIRNRVRFFPYWRAAGPASK